MKTLKKTANFNCLCYYNLKIGKDEFFKVPLCFFEIFVFYGRKYDFGRKSRKGKRA